MKTKRICALALIFAFAPVLLVGCADTPGGAVPEPVPEPAHMPAKAIGVPLMWRVTAPHGQIMYLFGSIHVADEGLYPLPDFIMDVFNRSDYLAVEFDMHAFSRDFEAQMEAANLMIYQDGRTIVDDIGEDLLERMRAVFSDMGEYIPDMFDMFKPAMWLSMLQLAAVEKAGLSGEHGLDMYFIEAATERGMTILEVESMFEQTQMLTGFSMPLQILMLEDSLDIERAALGVVYLYELWQQGDERGLLELFDYTYAQLPQELFEEYIDAMMIQRDIRMTEAARQYMAEGKTVFYVVGLAHMIGEDSIVYLLRNYGYTVQRVTP